MNNFFDYNNANGQVTLNSPDLLLIREFAALMDDSRNICKEDKTGKFHLRAFREFKYIYLALHWQSPYRDLDEQERHQEALKDSELTEEEFNNPEFRTACRKFKQLQESHRSIKMLKAAQNTVDNFIDYFNNLDLLATDPTTGKFLNKTKDVIAEISSLHKVHEEMVILEAAVKKELSEQSSIRAGAVDGYQPNF